MQAQKIILRDEALRQRAIDVIRLLKIEPMVLEVVIRPHKRNRSLDQNALYWKWLQIIGDYLGYTKDEMHVLLRYKFLGHEEREIAGEKILVLPSTTKLNVGEMWDYLNDIERFALSLGIRLPSMEDL